MRDDQVRDDQQKSIRRNSNASDNGCKAQRSRVTAKVSKKISKYSVNQNMSYTEPSQVIRLFENQEEEFQLFNHNLVKSTPLNQLEDLTEEESVQIRTEDIPNRRTRNNLLYGNDAISVVREVGDKIKK